MNFGLVNRVRRILLDLTSRVKNRENLTFRREPTVCDKHFKIYNHFLSQPSLYDYLLFRGSGCSAHFRSFGGRS
jgi:hypothetical protein